MRLAGSIKSRLADWISILTRGVDPPAVSASHALPSYLALSRRPGWPRTLDGRTTVLASQLAAELSGCRWCIDRGRHNWRAAGLSPELLQELSLYSTSLLFTARERAALTFVDAVALSGTGAYQFDEGVLQCARLFLSELELAELTALVAEPHEGRSSTWSKL